jgi:thiol-disulfide isomerase/thioredoxin
VLASGTIMPPTAKPIEVDLPDLGEAPEILNETWLNTDEPMTLASVRGKVVLLEFWTFGCINCRHVIPHVRDWYTRYNGDDFTVISVHYPEFNYERDIENVKQATADLGIEYAVAIDNDRLTWGAYNQRFWPTTYLIDKNGRIRYQHIGEGAYEKTETAIQLLMAEPEP